MSAGGIVVDGGLKIRSGGIDVAGQNFIAGAFTGIADEQNNGDSVFVGRANSPGYAGTLIDLESKADHTQFYFVRAKNIAGGPPVFEVQGDGSVSSAGGAVFSGGKGLSVTNRAALHGGLSLAKLVVKAGSIIELKAEGSCFVLVEDDGRKMKNVLTLGGREQGYVEGQVLVISNADEQPVHGTFEIPSGSTVMLLFQGEKWVDLQALRAPMNVSKCPCMPLAVRYKYNRGFDEQIRQTPPHAFNQFFLRFL